MKLLLALFLLSSVAQAGEVALDQVTDFDGYSCPSTDCVRFVTDGHLRGWKMESWRNGGVGREDSTLLWKFKDFRFKSVSLEDGLGCAITESGGLFCWDYRSQEGFLYGTKVPDIFAVKDVRVNRNYACALRSDSLTCWGRDRPAQTYPLREAVAFGSRAGAGACAIDADGLHCWDVSPEVAAIPAMRNPTAVDVGVNRACAIDGEKTVCWGTGETWDSNCRIEADGKRWCQGSNGIHYMALSLLPAPPLSHPRDVQLGREFACALGDEGVKCWSTAQFGRLAVPTLHGVTKFKIKNEEVCAWSRRGLTCWAYALGLSEGFLQHFTQVPRDLVSSTYEDYKFSPFTEEKSLGEFLSRLERVSSPARARLLHELGEYLGAELQLTKETSNEYWERQQPEAAQKNYARYWLMLALQPLVAAGDSKVLREKVAPDFLDSVELARSFELLQYKWLHFDMHTPAKTAANRRLFLKIIQASLQVGSDFLGSQDREQAAVALRALGEAFADPMDDQKMDAALAQVSGLAALPKLEANSKSAFLVQMIRAAVGWLKGAAQ